MRLPFRALACTVLGVTLALGCVDTSEPDSGSEDSSDSDADGASGGGSGDSDDDGGPATDQAPEGLSCGTLAAPEKVVLGYFPTWTNRYEETVAALDFDSLTHLAIAFVNPVGAGGALEYQGDEANMVDLIATAHEHDVKVLASLAGASDSQLFRSFIGDEAAVEAMVQQVSAFVDEFGLDGIDVDIEGSYVDGTYEGFILALAAELRPKGKLLTAAVARNSWDRISDKAMWCFDFLNLMTYDYAGTWSEPSEHSTLSQARQDLSYWVGRDYAASRTVLGMPFYGYCWGSGCEHGYTSFREIATKYPAATGLDWITEENVQISLNGTDTITKKTELAQAYGGVMVWELTLDSTDHLLWDALVAGLTPAP